MVIMTKPLFAAVLAAALFATCTRSEAKVPPRRPATVDGPREVAILAAGCFWGVEHWMNKASGIVDIDVGYVGGKSDKVSYDQVTTGTTGHAEAVRIVFDPTVISYEELLRDWFFRIHDPTTKNRQGNDEGPQYRSSIFPTTAEQRMVAEQVKARVDRSGKWKRPITTTVEAPKNWVEAEASHQDYLVKNPGGYDNHFLRDFTF
ncbi:MAG TPA: peptide-methionine (S)-S-oxide reductase MsrA [Kofleriaceae bacterium]|nr:peptide-methionine (S)-S-oxide reductase MsrA [Kofleriaceae bacterium]